MDKQHTYQPVIGLEIHIQLATKSKLFANDENIFFASPNTRVSAITLGHPGTLPKTNIEAINLAIKMGLICNSTIANEIIFDRKNYFYPDLPKGYQITQNTLPICTGGEIKINVKNEIKTILLNRIHLEEDAGKSIHDIEIDYSHIDLNRAGTPLIELVTEPCLHSAEEAFIFVQEIQKMVRWIGISTGNLEEGALRCDANISVRPMGSQVLGKKVEVKNINSFKNIKKAIEFEIIRIIGLLENGEKVEQQTRSFNADNNTTFALRDKEEANDYRYFIDPDLPPYNISNAYIENIKNTLPPTPHSFELIFKNNYHLSSYDVEQLTESIDIATFYDTLVNQKTYYKPAANFVLGPIKEYVNNAHKNFEDIKIDIPQIQQLIELVEEKKISASFASGSLMPIVLNTHTYPVEYCTTNNLFQLDDDSQIQDWINQVLQSMPQKVQEYNQGKKGLIGLFMGEVKKLSKGKANPQITTTLLEKTLQNLKK